MSHLAFVNSPNGIWRQRSSRGLPRSCPVQCRLLRRVGRGGGPLRCLPPSCLARCVAGGRLVFSVRLGALISRRGVFSEAGWSSAAVMSRSAVTSSPNGAWQRQSMSSAATRSRSVSTSSSSGTWWRGLLAFCLRQVPFEVILFAERDMGGACLRFVVTVFRLRDKSTGWKLLLIWGIQV